MQNTAFQLEQQLMVLQGAIFQAEMEELDLEAQVASMQKRTALLGQKVDAEVAKAKECAKKKDKRGALMALKRKKLLEAVRASVLPFLPCLLSRRRSLCAHAFPCLSSSLTHPAMCGLFAGPHRRSNSWSGR